MHRSLIWLSLLVPLTATAQDEGFDAHGFVLAPGDGDLHDLLTVWRPEVQVPWSYGADALFEYANQPLVLIRETGEQRERMVLLNDVLALNLGGHVALHERVAAGLTLPLYFYSSSPTLGGQGPAVGDMRLHVPVGLVLPAPWPSDAPSFGLSVVPTFDLPTGAQGRFLGSTGLGAGGFLVAGLNHQRWSTSIDAGAEFNPRSAYQNLHGGWTLNFGAGGSYAITDTLAIRGEATLRPTLTKNEFRMTETPSELLASVRSRYDSGLSWTAGAATALTRGASAARFRVFASIGYTAGKPFYRDLDGDGWADHEDACPEQPETLNGWADDDGCPDALAELRVQVVHPDGTPMAGHPVLVDGEVVGTTDEQGWVELADLQPDGAVTVGAEPADGSGMTAPEPVSIALEEGGNHEHVVELGWLPGSVRVIARTVQGEPIAATVAAQGPEELEEIPLGDDGQELFVLPPGEWAVFVSAPSFGTERRDVTIEPDQTSLVVIEVDLEPAAVQITREEVLILDQIHFDYDKAVIKDESIPVLEEVANNLLTHPEIEKIEIQGHTDWDGSRRYNIDLSQRRMESVVSYMVERGLDRDRLVPVGYGEDCPLVDNTTAENRAINRRVQFIILDPPPEDGVIPCHDGNPARRATERKVEVQETVESGSEGDQAPE